LTKARYAAVANVLPGIHVSVLVGMRAKPRRKRTAATAGSAK
jgi:hypothetical protein